MEGNPLVVYKSMNPYDWTKEDNPLLDKIQRPNEFPAFNRGEKGINIAGFFGDIHTSNRFSLGNLNSATFPVFISLQRPYIIDAKGEKSGNIQFGPTGITFRDAMRSGKYDGAIIKNTSDENDVYITTKPEQSKSAIGNKGTFNKKDPRLIESKKQFMENKIPLNIDNLYITKTKAGDGINYIILDNEKMIGHISGFEQEFGQFKDMFHLYKTELTSETRNDQKYQNKNIYKTAIQKVANLYKNGLFVNKYEASLSLRKSLEKMDTHELVNDEVITIKPKKGILS
jgi:hypothetical protein